MLCTVVHRRVLRGNDILASCAPSVHRTMWVWNFEKKSNREARNDCRKLVHRCSFADFWSFKGPFGPLSTCLIGTLLAIGGKFWYFRTTVVCVLSNWEPNVQFFVWLNVHTLCLVSVPKAHCLHTFLIYSTAFLYIRVCLVVLGHCKHNI